MVLFDVAVVGAGLAGLVCARKLQQTGYRVVVLEKSRGLGGRMATRRLDKQIYVDHGLPYLEIQGEQTEQLVKELRAENLLELWGDQSYRLEQPAQLSLDSRSDRYIAPVGMTAIAKTIASGLEIWRQCRVALVNYNPSSGQTWTVALEDDTSLSARAVVMAIPAPQAAMLLKASPSISNSELLSSLDSVQFDPCITAIAGYLLHEHPDWQVVKIGDQVLDQIIVDSSKRDASYPIVVLHSSAEFAKKHLEATDLQPVAEQMLDHAGKLLTWFNQSTWTWYQSHRWRYAFPTEALSTPFLSAEEPLPLVCCGDWCGGNSVESALTSGKAAAREIERQLSSN